MRTDRNFTGRLSFVPVTNLRPEKPNLFISYKMVGLGAVPTATVFRTPLICPTELEYSWPAHKQHFILHRCGNNLWFSRGDGCRGRRPCAPAGSSSIRAI